MENNFVAHRNYSCIILAAGQSKRMGQSKIVLPWGEKTIIGAIISHFQDSGIKQLIVVTGGYHELVEEELSKYSIETAYNPNFANGQMSCSLQIGMEKVKPDCDGVFVALGDQPEISTIDIEGIMTKSDQNPEKLIIPSYDMRRGHPWLIPARLFPEILQLQHPQTMRTFIQSHEDEIEYYLVNNSNILTDLDTPEDYHRQKPKSQ
ncbi:MAG: NTP transferase domain-containing protein [Anaerolineaceae bacterium]